MESMEETKNCHTCGSADLLDSSYQVIGKFPLSHCANCGLGFLKIDDALSQEDVVDEYWNEINCKIYTTPNVVNELRKKYQFYFLKIKKQVPGTKHLDVGSGAGICVNTGLEMGFDSFGVEPSISGVNLAQYLSNKRGEWFDV